MPTTETPEQLRKAAYNFALEAYAEVKHNRLYALTEHGKVALAALARYDLGRGHGVGRGRGVGVALG